MTNQLRRSQKLNTGHASRNQRKDPHHWHHKVRGRRTALLGCSYATAASYGLSSAAGVQLRYEPQILVEKEVVECTLLMLLGVQSWLFTWDDVKEVPGRPNAFEGLQRSALLTCGLGQPGAGVPNRAPVHSPCYHGGGQPDVGPPHPGALGHDPTATSRVRSAPGRRRGHRRRQTGTCALNPPQIRGGGTISVGVFCFMTPGR